jgi:tripartite motif-containing protein 71
MCESASGSVVVCDSHNRRVFEIHLDGRPHGVIVQYEGSGRRPVAVAQLEDDFVMSDVSNQQLYRVGRDSVVRWAVGSRGPERSQFRFPWDVKVLQDGRVIVSDRDNNRLQLLDPTSGAIIGSLTPVHAGLVMESPRGIAIDRSGLVYVVDAGRSRVLQMHADGRVVRAFGSRGSGEGQLDEPCGVAVDAVGNILVADYNNNRIVVFRPDGSATHFAVPRVQPVRVLVDSQGRVLTGGSRDEDGTTTDAQIFLF